MDIRSYLINISRPFARCLARALDYSFFYAFFILPLFFTSLLDDDIVHLICVVLVPLLWIPFEALLLAFLGTTPGKALFGIHIRDNNKKKLSLAASLKRSVMIWLQGLGANLPILNLLLIIKNFKRLNTQEATSWDKSHKIFFYYKKRTYFRTLLGSLLMALFAIFFVAEYEVREVITSSHQAFFSSKNFNKIGWKSYVDPQGAYSLAFPSTPEVSETKIAIPKSRDSLPFRTIHYLNKEKEIEYNLTHTILPDNWLKWNSALLLRGALKVVASRMAGQAKILKKHTERYKGYPAVDFVLQKKSNKLCAGRLILIGNILYKIEVTYPQHLQEELQDEIHGFLETFQPS